MTERKDSNKLKQSQRDLLLKPFVENYNDKKYSELSQKQCLAFRL